MIFDWFTNVDLLELSRIRICVAVQTEMKKDDIVFRGIIKPSLLLTYTEENRLIGGETKKGMLTYLN